MSPSDLSADLPAPRDDEPASLRNDIADELRDHLECATRREELSSHREPWGSAPRPDPENISNADASFGRSPDRATPAYQRALANFGNPRAVARKLWFDAMREKLMGQRLSLVLQGIMAAAVMVMCVIVYQSLQQTAHTQGMLIAMLNKSQQEMLEAQRAANAQLVERLAALPQSGSAAPAEWNPLTVQCRFDSENGPPAAGVKVVLDSESDNTAGIPTTEQISGEDGSIDFGQVLYGEYALHYTAPNGMQRTEKVSVMPGQAKDVTMICPRGDGLTTVIPRPVPSPSDLPPSALTDQLWYYVRMQRRHDGFKTWQRNADGRSIDWLIGPQGQVLDVTALAPVKSTRQYADRPTAGFQLRSSLPPGPLNEFIAADMLIPMPPSDDPATPAQIDVRAEPGTYEIHSVWACLLHPDTSAGMRLLLLTPPRHLAETGFRSMFGPRGNRGDDELSTFTVIYDKPATVVIPLRSVRFSDFDLVLKAAPGHVAWRYHGRSLPEFQLRPGWSLNEVSAPELPAILGIRTASEATTLILTGIEVVGWEQIDMVNRESPRLRRDGPSEYKVTAILLVTPEERDLLQKHEAKLGIAIDAEGTPRSQLTPEIVQALDAAPLPAEESTSPENTEQSATP